MEITGGEGVKAVVDGIGLATWEVRARDLDPLNPDAFPPISR